MPSIPSIVFSSIYWAALSTSIVMIISIPMAYCLARYDFKAKNIIATILSLPLVLPPTAVGYLILQILADNGPLGRNTLGIDFDILLTWKGIILSCCIMSMPLVIRTARVSFEEVNPRLELMSRTLGYSRFATFFYISLPLAKRGLIAAMILGFTRAMGEFGASIIVAGNIPGQTQTLSSAIYNAQQAGNEARGNLLLIIALLIGFTAVFLTERLSRPQTNKEAKIDE